MTKHVGPWEVLSWWTRTNPEDGYDVFLMAGAALEGTSSTRCGSSGYAPSEPPFP